MSDGVIDERAPLSVTNYDPHKRDVVAPADIDLDYAVSSERLAIAKLVLTEPLRSNGVDSVHLQRLISADCELPPILVHRPTMRVLDGFHRVAAALERGEKTICVHYVSGSVESAFVLAVAANVRHGLPLPLSDRRAAASRILLAYPQWSDRRIAAATGLSARTVANIRPAGEANGSQQECRVGKDGRLRPLSTAAGRALAAELIKIKPHASLREVAAVAGISPGTVRDVRDKLRRGENPICGGSPGTHRDRDNVTPHESAKRTKSSPADTKPLLQVLSRDPALRMTERGRELLRWLHLRAVSPSDGVTVSQHVPDHCVDQFIELAARCAAVWANIAEDLRAQQPDWMPAGEAPQTHGMRSTA